MVKSKRKKPITKKSKKLPLIITSIVLIAFGLCIFAIMLDSFGICSVKNIDNFWKGFFVFFSFFAGYVVGDNASRQE